MITFLVILFVWFGLGVLYAPRAAAHGYKHCPYGYEKMRKDSAKAWYWLTLFFGPVMIATMFTRLYVVGAVKGQANNRLDQALIRHDEDYRKKYAVEQERRIAKLERDNERLMKDILR